MARAKVILVDADVIAHFMATGHILELDAIKENNARFPVDRMEDYKTEKDLGEF